MKLAASLTALVTAWLTASPLLAQTPAAAPTQDSAAPAATEATPVAKEATPADPPPAPLDTPPPITPEKKPRKEHTAFVTFSPIHLLFPVVEVTAEFRLHERVGVAVIGGIGSVDPYKFSTSRPADAPTGNFLIWEAGGQIVAYPVGTIEHGLQLGAEVLYVGVDGKMSSGGETVTGTGSGLGLSPLIGYKFTAPVGFTLNIQAGVTYYTVRAEAKSSSEMASKSEEGAIAPLLNLNLGWAF